MKSIKEIRESNLSLAAAKATNLAVSTPTKANHLAAVKAHKEAQGFFKGQSHDYHLNKAIEHAKKASEMKEEYGAGEEGSDDTTQKYKDETPGQSANESVLKKKSSDMARVNAGAMSKSEFDAKWKKPAKKSLAGPGGLYKNLVKEGADEDMAKHHAAAQAAKAAGDNDAFHKHMDAKFEVAKKRDAENAKKPVTRMGEALEEACWKGCEEMDQLKDKTHLDESVIHSAKAAKFSQKAKDNPSIATHTKASSAHTKAAASYEKKIAAHIKANGESSLLKPMEDKAKHHERSATVHRFMAHRILKKNVNESTETVTESPEDKKNLKITKHSQLAINAEKRGDTAAQAFHLRLVSKLKTESVTENKHVDDDQEEIIMAKGQLLQIADMAKDLSDMLEDDDELEAWIQGKITTSLNELDDVHSYMEYTDDLYDDQHDVKEQFESLDEAVDSSELARIQMLVRLGLIDKLKLNVITRAIKKLDNSASITTTAEKDVLFDLLQKLISLITSDEMIFKKIKLSIGNTQ